MGQKISSKGLRLSINNNWDSTLFSDSFNYSSIVYQNIFIKNYIKGILYKYNIFCDKVLIKRVKDKVFIYIYFFNFFQNQKNNKLKKNALKSLSKNYKKEFNKKTFHLKGKVLDYNDLLKFKGIGSSSLKKIILNNLSLITNNKIILFSRNLVFNNRKLSKSMWDLSKKVRLSFNRQDNLLFTWVIRTALVYRSSTLLCNYLSIIFTKHIKNCYKFFNILSDLCRIFFIHYNLKGIRILFKGRLNGALRSRTYLFSLGKIPTQTLNAKINYSQSECITIYGICGIKVWIC